jgi:RND family efflux transporter MFP subunit
MTRGLIVFVVVAFLTATSRWLLASIAESREPKPGPTPPMAVRVTSLSEEVVATGIRYTAMVKELQKVELSFRVAGTVDRLHQVEGPGKRLRNVHEGDQLTRGTVIAQLDPNDYRRERGMAAERLAASEARLIQVKADAELAEIEYRRAELLSRRNAISSSEVDASRAKMRNTGALAAAAGREVESARLSLEQAEVNLSYCTLTVPFERASVAARYVDANERVTANQRAFTLIDVTSVVIAFGVPDTFVSQLEIGQKVDVECDALPNTISLGVIHKIASMSDLVTRTYSIEVRVDEPRGLRPGMVASVRFRRDRKASLLPLTSVAPGDAKQSYVVYRVVEEAGKLLARQVPVRLDGILDNRVAIRLDTPEGLARGDRVVVAGLHRLHDGELVQVVE